MKRIEAKDIAGLEIVGKGACATVYRLDEEKILKLYDRNLRSSQDFVEKEFNISTAVYNMGIPSARPYELYDCGGAYGASYEFLSGSTMLDLIIKGESVENHIRVLAEIGKMIHSHDADKELFPDAAVLFERLLPYMKGWLPEDGYRHIERLVAAVPECGRLVHGDFHPGNVIVHGGKTVLIDVGGAGYGHPVFDLISMYRMMKKAERAKNDNGICSQIFEAYLKCCFGESGLASQKGALLKILDILYYLTVIPSACAQYPERESCPPAIAAYIDAMFAVLAGIGEYSFARLFEETVKGVFNSVTSPVLSLFLSLGNSWACAALGGSCFALLSGYSLIQRKKKSA